MKAILTSSPGSHYDDLPESRYHFPSTYLKQVRDALEDWIIYYEPRRDSGLNSSGGKQAYVATAKVKTIIEDRNKPNHYYAEIVDYLEFDNPVPFREGEHYYESALRKEDGTTNKGAFGRAVRSIPEDEFQLILRAGFTKVIEPWASLDDAVAEEHPIVEQLIRRKFRDQAFRRHVRQAYNNTCAVTGLCLINGGGRPEVEAAHIRPVAEDGPDSVRNGIALTGTVHWLFDRGLLSIDEQYKLLVSTKADLGQFNGLIQAGQEIAIPIQQKIQPHPGFIQWHRENRFIHS